MFTIASRYNAVVPCPDGGHLLYNQMSGALLVLNDRRLAEYESLAKGGGSGPFHDLLRSGQFLIAADSDERDMIADQWGKVVYSSQMKAVTIVPTDRCNLGCGYCYEEKAGWELMSPEIAMQVMNFVQRLILATPTKRLAVTWFGGEPTLNMNCVEALSLSFITTCDQLGIAYEPFLVTNGTTLTPRVLEKLRRCRIRRMQVTVDGLAGDHDVKRPYLADVVNPNEAQKAQLARINLPVLDQQQRAPRSSFATIMANARAAREHGFEVKIRMNTDRANQAGVRDLFRLLQAEGLLERHSSGGVILAYSAPIFEGCGGCSPQQMTRGEHAAFEAELRAEGLATDSWRFRDLRFTGATCTANLNYDFVINQRGELTKCWHHATDGKHVIGTVADLHLAELGSRGSDPLAFDPLEDAECRDCPVLPLCMGGCKANNEFPQLGYQGRKDMGCHAARFTLPDHVVAMYRLRKTENAGRP
jgi:uncharacterized protein